MFGHAFRSTAVAKLFWKTVRQVLGCLGCHLIQVPWYICLITFQFTHFDLCFWRLTALAISISIALALFISFSYSSKFFFIFMSFTYSLSQSLRLSFHLRSLRLSVALFAFPIVCVQLSDFLFVNHFGFYGQFVLVTILYEAESLKCKLLFNAYNWISSTFLKIFSFSILGLLRILPHLLHQRSTLKDKELIV